MLIAHVRSPLKKLIELAGQKVKIYFFSISPIILLITGRVAILKHVIGT
jgi:hypothetical protein